ncbi:hypothetical protein ACJMK2_015603 [Sinanodonta woodiana]|uniref:Uncharacterized protein n=1 Tax=Sinanodonta woodiana TaxID=1069815 RepID=A0ABD3UU48_SINWO
MKYTGKQFLADVVSSLVFVLTVASAQCPQNAHQKVQLCTSSILPKWSTGTNFGVPRHHTRETCRTKLHDCAECIQKIMDQCQGTTEQEQILQRLINKEKLLETVEYFCHNFKVYEKNVDCISKQHTDVAACTEPARVSFQHKLAAGATMDVLITGTCRFHGVARNCLTDIVEKHCGQEPATLVYNLLTGLVPPYCNTISPEYSPDSSSKPNDRWPKWKGIGSSTSNGNTLSVRTVFMLILTTFSIVSIHISY